MSGAGHFTRFGLPGVEQAPFGMHACHVYRDREELASAMVPYFAAGLAAHERCLWITAPPLPAAEAVEALRGAWPTVDEALAEGALRVVDYDAWYRSAGGLKGLEVVQLWLAEEERALAEGYQGLRVAGNLSFLAPGDWPEFMAYEQAVTAQILGRRIVALCSYPQEACDARRTSEVRRAHHCAFERPGETWQVVTEASAPRA